MLGDKRRDFVFGRGRRRRKGTVFAEIAMSAGEPNNVTASVHDERESLRRSAKAERNGIATIAAGKEWRGGGGGSTACFGGGAVGDAAGLGAFEVMSSF